MDGQHGMDNGKPGRRASWVVRGWSSLSPGVNMAFRLKFPPLETSNPMQPTSHHVVHSSLSPEALVPVGTAVVKRTPPSPKICAYPARFRTCARELYAYSGQTRRDKSRWQSVGWLFVTYRSPSKRWLGGRLCWSNRYYLISSDTSDPVHSLLLPKRDGSRALLDSSQIPPPPPRRLGEKYIERPEFGQICSGRFGGSY